MRTDEVELVSLEAEIPEGWTQRRLGECADQRTEKVQPDATDSRRYVALEHLAQGWPAILGWSVAGCAVSAKTVFRKGDVLFGKLRPNLRKAAVAPFDGLCSTDILPIFGRDGLETPYLLQLAQSDHLRQYAIATASGTKMPRTSWRQLSEFLVNLPPASEQREIAAVLSAVDDVIEKSREAVEQYRVVKCGLLQELVQRRDCNIRWAALSEVVDLRLSSVDKLITPGQRTVRLCNYRDVYYNEVIVDSMEFMEATATEREVNNCQLHAGDVVITKDSETPKDIGVPAVIRGSVKNLVCGYHLAILRPQKSVLDGEYLHYALCTEEAKRQFQMYANGVTRFGLRRGDIERIRVPLPVLAEQRKIAGVLSAVDDLTKQTEATIRQAQVAKRSLMSALLAGELRVATRQ